VTQPVLISQSTAGDAGELLTNDDTLDIDVPGLYYFLNVNGIAASSGVQDGPHAVSHLGDGLHHLTALTFDAAGNETSSAELTVRIDTVAPKVTSADFLRDGGPARIRIAFDENVSQSLTASDLELRNLTTGELLAGAAMSYDAQANVATWTFDTLAAGQLPTGDYAAVLVADGVTDRAANPIDGDRNGSAGGNLVISFFHFHGDANLDRSVDFNDLVALAQSYNTAGGKTWAEGDFTGDGAVDFNDLVQLAQNYNTSLTGAAAAGAPLSFDAAMAAAFASVTTPALTQPTATLPELPIVAPPPVAQAKPPVVVKQPVAIKPPAPVQKPIKAGTKPVVKVAAKPAALVVANAAQANAPAVAFPPASTFGTTRIKDPKKAKLVW
jgi:hypothetical protein